MNISVLLTSLNSLWHVGRTHDSAGTLHPVGKDVHSRYEARGGPEFVPCEKFLFPLVGSLHRCNKSDQAELINEPSIPMWSQGKKGNHQVKPRGDFKCPSGAEPPMENRIWNRRSRAWRNFPRPCIGSLGRTDIKLHLCRTQ